ncbi:MAG: single-stranded DNA-binding protein [Spirochaetales bacterium]|nr:single-stranded DNA-binding protein [Spirochaetales bacterium]
MNALNSIILEGDLTGDPYIPKEGVCEFEVVSIRYSPTNEKEESHFLIRTTGKIANICLTNLKELRSVRAVGRIKEEAGKHIIIAEHIEFRPRRSA